jgi:hypothetical protein
LTPPPLDGSFVTVALRLALALTGMELGAPLIGETVMTGTFTVTTEEALALGLAVELAVMLTARPPEGTVAGAV